MIQFLFCIFQNINSLLTLFQLLRHLMQVDGACKNYLTSFSTDDGVLFMQKEGFRTWGCGIRNSLSPFSLLLGVFYFFIFRSSNVQNDFKKKMIRKLKLLNTEYYNAIKIFIQIQKFGYRFIHFILKAFKVIHHHDIMTERICRKMTLVGHNHHTYLLMLTI